MHQRLAVRLGRRRADNATEGFDGEGFSHLALSTLRRAALGAAADLGFEVTADDFIITPIADWAIEED